MIVTGQSAPELSAVLKTDNHLVNCGVVASLGGADQGMNPHELLQASLAACTLITLQMYADRKRWVIGPIEVKVSLISESREASGLRREIKFSGHETAEQQTRLLEIADKCPIHILLESTVTIETVRTS